MPENAEFNMIHRYLTGGMDGTERTDFEHRLAQDPALMRLKEEQSRLWLAAASYPKPEFDHRQAFQKFQSNLHRNPVRRRIWIASAAAAVVLLLIGAYFILWQEADIQDVYAQTLVTKTLEDGSQIELRPGAHMRIPEKFDASYRKVEIVSGEVFFSISPDKSRPFLISNTWGDVKVVGTQFVITVDTSSATYSILVTEGTVQFMPAQSSDVETITAGHGIRFQTTRRVIERVREIDQNEISWHTGELSFDNTPLTKVIADLQNHYDVHIIFDESMGHCGFTSPMPYKDVEIRKILDALAVALSMKLKEVDASHYIFTGGSCE